MGKRRDWPSPDAIAEMAAHIRAKEPDILSTHHLVGTEKDCTVFSVHEGRLFGLLADDAYIKLLIGALKTAGKPIYPTERDIPGVTLGDVEVEGSG